MKNHSRWLLLAPLWLLGCPAYPQPAPAPAAPSPEWVDRAKARWSDTSDAELKEGHQVFTSVCNDCHEEPDVTILPEDEWPATVHRMAKYADLDPTKARAALRFILTSRAAVFGKTAAFENVTHPAGGTGDSAGMSNSSSNPPSATGETSATSASGAQGQSGAASGQ